jgi:hypothetical protein
MVLQNFGIHLRDYKVTRSGRPQSEQFYQLYPIVYFRNPLTRSGMEILKLDTCQFGCVSENKSYEAILTHFIRNTFRSTLIKLQLHHRKIRITVYCTNK